MPEHVHVNTPKLRVFRIPSDYNEEAKLVEVDNTLDAYRAQIGGGYIEIVRTPLMPTLECGCAVVMVVDEDGLLKRLKPNTRASVFYPFEFGIAGDAFLVGEGLVNDSIDGVDLDFFGLPVDWVPSGD